MKYKLLKLSAFQDMTYKYNYLLDLSTYLSDYRLNSARSLVDHQSEENRRTIQQDNGHSI